MRVINEEELATTFSESSDVYQHNAWDDVDWDGEQLAVSEATT